jgi:ribonuclease T2
MKTSTRRVYAAALALLLFAGFAGARSRRKKSLAMSQDFDYYLLVLSYAPDFCDQPQGRKDPRECGSGRHIGFLVHGLWPQSETSRGPENCGGASPVSAAIVQSMLKYFPTESLIQHEWTSHGTCTGLSAADYFANVRKARDSVAVPLDLDQPSRSVQTSPSQIEAKFSAANPSYLREAFRTSCYRDAGELNEVRICLNKDLSPRQCGSSAGECPLPNVTLLPVR